jgi:hypothetical protein
VKVSDGEWEDWRRGRTEWVKKVDKGSEVGRWKGWKRVDGMSGVR